MMSEADAMLAELLEQVPPNVLLAALLDEKFKRRERLTLV